MRNTNWGITLALQITLVLFTAPFVIRTIINPVAEIERWDNISAYYDNPDYFTINGTIVSVDYLESGNWPNIRKTTEIHLDSGHIILKKGWETGMILQENYSFGYKINYEGEYDLDYPDYIRHIRNVTNKTEETQ